MHLVNIRKMIMFQECTSSLQTNQNLLLGATTELSPTSTKHIHYKGIRNDVKITMCF